LHTQVDAPRVVWAWADAAFTAAVAAGGVSRPQALKSIEPDQVAVVAEVPMDRCLVSSFTAWDATVLRSRYAAVDIEDAAAFYDRWGAVHADTLTACPDGMADALVASWVRHGILGGPDTAMA